MGLGRFGGGAGVTRWLAGQGAEVLVTDLADEHTLHGALSLLAGVHVEYCLGGHDTRRLAGADLLVVSPAVPQQRSDFFQEAVRRGIPWTTGINLFLERCPSRVVGVTGTAGKSTTAAMIHAIVGQVSDRGVAYLGGNIGGSLLDDLGRMTRQDTVVLELSSFQLADLTIIARRPDVAVFVTMFPNHLDRHGTFDAYLDCKINMIRGARPGTPVVLGVEDNLAASRIVEAGKASAARMVPLPRPGPEVRLAVPGDHNRHNARCAAAAAAVMGIDEGAVKRGLESFLGLPHRLQLVGNQGAVDFYDDSKSTHPRATITALRSFDRPVIALVGGQARDTCCDELARSIIECTRTTICFGSAASMVHQAVMNAAADTMPINLLRTDTLEQAVRIAQSAARPGDVVLLSPGFQSFDEFTNYAHRGETFSALVRADRRQPQSPS